MVRIHPDIDAEIKCSYCGNSFPAQDIHFTGLHVLCSGLCPYCKKDTFYKEMPASAGLHYPVMIRRSDGERADDMPFTNWFIGGLVRAYKNRTDDAVSIRKVVNKKKPTRKVLLLNTIDHTYGHCILTLFNLSYYVEKKDYQLILLVQRNLLWLVPDGVDEVWVVDIPFSKADRWYTSLESEVKKEIESYEEAFLCRSLPQASEGEFPVENYTRVKPFNLDDWDGKLEKPCVTFIWRADRFWKPVMPRLINNRYTQRMFPAFLKNVNRRIQFNWVLKFAETLKERVPNLDFAVAGMDVQKPRLPSWIKDLRHPHHEDGIARTQCERYAQSHLVIGCNGSSLVLPSFHAGSVVNIVPPDGWAVSASSFRFRFTSLADTHFRYLLLPAETSIVRTAKIVVQMLRDRPQVQILSGKFNDHENQERPEVWAAFRRAGFENTKHFNEKEGMITKPMKPMSGV